MEIENRGLAVITGASSGIGYELAKVFAENGYDLLVCAEDAGIAEAASAFSAYNRKVDYVQANLARTEGVERLYQKIKSLGEPVEVLCINAGVGVGGEFIKNSIQEEINLINLNITSAVHLTKLVMQDMVQEGQGRILFTSSIAAEMPGPYYAVYAASKAFLQSFAEAIRYEVKDKGIVVTSLQPGATDTNFFERARMTDTKAGQAKKDAPSDVAKDGFEAVMSGKDHIVAGSFMNKLKVAVAKFITEPQQAKIHSRDVKPRSANL
ncbi:MAG: SDR family NAD(P)-dependent oxidoreductase [Bdellovibrionales bacterium]